MHVLVTGAGGFIGRNVVNRIHEAGWQVTGVARRPCSEADLIADLRMPIKTWPVPDSVIHLAGGYAGGNEREMAAADLAIARNVFAWGKRVGIRRWVLASAAEVYGCIEDLATEDAATIPVIPYGSVKLAVERLFVQMANEIPDCRAVILRIGEVYGNNGRLLHELTTRLNSGFCPWPGSGLVVLSFVHVGAVAQAIERALEHGQAGISIYNVADDEPTTWRTFVQHLAELLRTRPPVFLPRSFAYVYMLGQRLKDLICRQQPVLTSHAIRLLTTPKPLSTKTIKLELGFTPQFQNIRCGLEASLDGLPHHT